MKPVVASLVWFKEGHYLEPPQLNGVPNLPSLLHPSILIIFISYCCEKLTKISCTLSTVRPDDPLCNYVPESVRTNEVEVIEDPPPAVIEPSSDESRPTELDLNSHLLVMGIMELQLLQLPIQPRRFSEWTVAPRKPTVISTLKDCCRSKINMEKFAK